MERKYRPLEEGEKVYWLTCLNKTTNWYQSAIETIEGEQIYFPGDITWALTHSKEGSVLPERNRHYVTYKGSDFAKIYGEPLTEEEFEQRFYKKESTKLIKYVENKAPDVDNIATYKNQKLRIKTFAEFGNERPYSWAHSGAMDYLYGQYITKEKSPKIFETFEKTGQIISGGYEQWALAIADMVIEPNPYVATAPSLNNFIIAQEEKNKEEVYDEIDFIPISNITID